jgi:plastocyanin
MLRLLARARTFGVGVALATASLGIAAPVPAAASPAEPAIIGVGHFDPVNQQFDPVSMSQIPGGRFWQYFDFFARGVTVQTGTTLDFRTAPNEFHVVALAKDGPAFRALQPIFVPDSDDPSAAGSGAPKVSFGPGAVTLFNPPGCGIGPLPDCAPFDGVNPIIAGSIGGQPLGPVDGPGATAAIASHSADWRVTVTAAPGTYNYLCLIHPEMNGTLTVVPAGSAVTNQKEISRLSALQFAQDHAQALRVENAGTVWHPDGAGHRVFEAHASAQTPNGHVGLLEMLPRSLKLQVGDSVHWSWAAGVELHTVTFPANNSILPQPTGIDCADGSYAPFNLNGPPPAILPCAPEPGEATAPPFIPFELIFDPGNARPGQLNDPSTLVNSGVLVGADYGLSPAVQDWSAVANTVGTFAYQCTLHDWMQGSLTVVQKASA